jgi:hypothetical protein
MSNPNGNKPSGNPTSGRYALLASTLNLMNDFIKRYDPIMDVPALI